MLHGQFQGGSAGAAPSEGFGLKDADGNIAIEKYMRWNWAFFLGAVLTFATACGTMFFWLSHFTFAPATFFFEIFLFLFGAIMLVLDTPIPGMQHHKHIKATRLQIYKFFQILTRFMGRGMFYLYLSTMVFGSLYDTGINWFLGAVCTTYLFVLGVVAIGKGFLLTHKLNKVRDSIMAAGLTAERFMPPHMASLSPEQFKHMVEQATGEKDLFNDDEMEYIVNALSFTPYHNNEVTLEELQYWLQAGPPMMV